MKTNQQSKLKLIALLEQLKPKFYDDVIYSRYANFENSKVKKLAKLIGFKDDTNSLLLSNLKEVKIDLLKDIKLRNLCFYPPHSLERKMTMGVVTFDQKMIITKQKFKRVNQIKEGD